METKIDFLYLNEQDMIAAGVKDMEKCVKVMEDMMVTLKKGDYVMGGENHNSHGCMVTFPDQPKFEGMPKNGEDRRFMAMPAYLGGRFQMAGMKWYGSNIENRTKGLPRSILMMMLNDKDTGAPLALMSANLLSAYRTGAIPGVGAKYLAPKNAQTAAIIGPGVMGKTSLCAFVSVCPELETVKIKGRSQRSIDSFTDFVRKECPQIKEILVCGTMEEAVRGSDIISTTTSVGNKEIGFPFIDDAWIKKGALICMPSAARFNEAFYVAPDTRLVVDNHRLYEAWADEYPYPSYDAVQVVGAKFMDLLHDHKIQMEDIVDIADVITDTAVGRRNADERIIYSVGGMPVEDIAWGKEIYENALRMGIGTKLPLWERPELA